MAEVLLWYSSSLAKRYSPETGSAIVAELFRRAPLLRMAAAASVYAETYAALVRKSNSGHLTRTALIAALSSLYSDFAREDFDLLDVPSSTYFSCTHLIRSHNINSSDAVILFVCLEYARAVRADGD